jgi:UDP-N-acetylglucosamine diphosphorylase/glucosamine-1-phosphate N-acetyltransferase
MNHNTAAVILAAGKGKRMKSDLPKVLHKINGKPLIRHLLETFTGIAFKKIAVVIGHKGEMVVDELKDFKIDFVWQEEQRGTGDAVKCAMPHLKHFHGYILVANGDIPFPTQNSLESLINSHHESGAAATCLTVEKDDPKDYGRIVRGKGIDELEAIVEKKDATDPIMRIREINSGFFCFNSSDLAWALNFLDDSNVQKEYYITDTIKILRKAGKSCRVFRIDDPLEVEGVNSVEELRALEAAFNARKK